MKLENSPKHHPAANGMVQKRSAARDWVDQSTEGRIGYEHHADNRTEHPVMTFMVSRAATIINILCGPGRQDTDGGGTRDDRKQIKSGAG